MNAIKAKLFLHKRKIDAAINLVKAVADFAYTKSKLSLVSGGILAATSFVSDYYSPEQYFSIANNYTPLFNNNSYDQIFASVLSSFPSKLLEFEHGSASLIEFDEYPIGVVHYEYNPKHKIYIRIGSDKGKIIKKLADLKFKSIASNLITITISKDGRGDRSLNLNPLVITSCKSELSEKYIDYFQKTIETNFQRSLLLYGNPGTGKSTLAQTIINELGLRTLKFHSDKELDVSTILFLVKIFNIEAVIFDDLDQMPSGQELFEFLELLYKQCKILIGTSNTIDNFHPAIIRPGRFDELLEVNSLDEATVKSILGECSWEYFDKVKNWPIAYIQELSIQQKINRNAISNVYDDLMLRVERNSKLIGKNTKGSKEQDSILVAEQ